MLAENVTLDYMRVGGLGNVCHPLVEDGITVVCMAVLGQEAHQSLS